MAVPKVKKRYAPALHRFGAAEGSRSEQDHAGEVDRLPGLIIFVGIDVVGTLGQIARLRVERDRRGSLAPAVSAMAGGAMEREQRASSIDVAPAPIDAVEFASSVRRRSGRSVRCAARRDGVGAPRRIGRRCPTIVGVEASNDDSGQDRSAESTG
jgi:hypothetical protein